MDYLISHKDQILQIILISSVFVFFYIFSIRPQKKKYNDQKKFIKGLKSGNKIITLGGIHGSIIDIDSSTVTIQIDKKGTTMIIEKSSISMDSTLKLSQ